uniref:Angiopoietin-related protein 5-like n=1 Tax=Geotrypetes seraphini TaxID=260995 RepID=A0A6P8SA09_GEOSA|nr:angiopoietin-related protein 5-like [Geotrypetes seraphini]
MNSASLLKCFSGIAILLCLSLHQVKPKQSPLPAGEDCSGIWKKDPKSASGVYWIKPAGAPQSFQAYCDMNQDGGSTVIQRHNGEDSLDFNRMWQEYKDGFGNPAGEHWIGLEKIYLLSNQPNKKSELSVNLQSFNNDKACSKYESFQISNEAKGYQLSLGAYSGTGGDAFRGQDNIQDYKSQEGSKFSTIDMDNDDCNPCIRGDIAMNSCSQSHDSGWWFSACGMADLNGEWHSKDNYMDWESSIYWKTWKPRESMKMSELKLKTV